MLLPALTRIITPMRTSLIKGMPKYYGSLYTPDYLESMKPKFPQYPVINVQMRGYDYPILESFQGHVARLADRLDIDVDDSFGLPPKSLKIQRFKPKSANVDVEYKLDIYERNIQLSNLSSLRLPIFCRLVEAMIPEGVMLKFEVWNPEREELRYIPDTQLLNLQSELEGITRKKA